MSAIDMLMEEHRLIEKVMFGLEQFADKLEDGETADRKDFIKFAEFFREFADRCHHGKEEDILFEEMIECGFNREAGPVAVMLYEHGVGREKVQVMRNAGESDEWNDEIEEEAIHAARDFIVLLRDHILKEDNILFPMAANQLPENLVDGLLEKFNEFNSQKLGNDKREKLKELGQELSTQYDT